MTTGIRNYPIRISKNVTEEIKNFCEKKIKNRKIYKKCS